MKKKRIVLLIVIIFCTLVLNGCVKKDLEVGINSNSRYMVVYSDILEPTGGYFTIDDNGEIIGKLKNIEMQDLGSQYVSSEGIILSGNRKNNTIIIERGCNVWKDDMVFLNNKSYSGVTALLPEEDGILAIMNGNVAEDTYLNLLVDQAYDGTVRDKCILEIFARDVLRSDQKVIIVGDYWNIPAQETTAELVEYDGNATYHKFNEYTSFIDILETEDEYICIAADSEYNNDRLVVIDKNEYCIRKELEIPFVANSLFEQNNMLYVVGNDGLYKIDIEADAAEPMVNYNELIIGEECYPENSYLLDGKIYVMLRYGQKHNNRRYSQYGKLLVLDLESGEEELTEIKVPNNIVLSHLFVFPITFMETYENS